MDALPCQLVHGDLGGNILFDPHLPPAVIDVTPYWRPKWHADVIILGHAIAWAGAGRSSLEPLRDPVGVQRLYGAILFRLGTTAITFNGHEERLGVEVAAYQPIVEALGIV